MLICSMSVIIDINHTIWCQKCHFCMSKMLFSILFTGVVENEKTAFLMVGLFKKRLQTSDDFGWHSKSTSSWNELSIIFDKTS